MTLEELETYYSFYDVVLANEVLDIQAEAEELAAKKAGGAK